MQTIDWIIVIIPIIVVMIIALKAQKYVKSVSDFLAAGRVAGRYVVAVAGGEAAMGLISLVALFEMYYSSGFAVSYWNQLMVPLGMIITLTGYCIYRFRETKAFTMGQFFEMRYSKTFRVFSAVLQSFSGVLNYAIFPAVGARFLIYFCDLPLEVEFLGSTWPTFGIVMFVFLSVAVTIVCLGGQITIMVTDCVQGILSYPLYGVIVATLLLQFSWSDEIAPALLQRPPGLSMLNPFDTHELRDFNIFFIFVGIFSAVFNRMSWSGSQGYNAAALNAHEQKMGAVLGTWRGGFSAMMVILLSATAFCYLNIDTYKSEAKQVRSELIDKALLDVAGPEDYRRVNQQIAHAHASDAAIAHAQASATAKTEGQDPEHAMQETQRQLADIDKNKAQTFSAIYGQMRVPMALKNILPVGILGMFCAMCIFLLISTDTTYMHSWGCIIVQDIIVPLRKTPISAKEQLRYLRLVIAGVAAFAFIFSYYFAQVDFILMFFAITGAIWLGGAGPCIVGGLYWKKGTTAGAFASLIFGSVFSVLGIILQKTWVGQIYPWLEQHQLHHGLDRFLRTCSSPFEPLISWRVTAEQFPINSQEMYFITMICGVSLYIIVSYLTSKKDFNMEKLLHRGKYHEGDPATATIEKKWSLHTAWDKIFGIDEQYSKVDKGMAYGLFIYSVVWGCGSFLIILLLNTVSPWSNDAWVDWFFVSNVIVPGIVAFISIIVFTIGGIRDLKDLFERLQNKQIDENDNGQVMASSTGD